MSRRPHAEACWGQDGLCPSSQRDLQGPSAGCTSWGGGLGPVVMTCVLTAVPRDSKGVRPHKPEIGPCGARSGFAGRLQLIHLRPLAPTPPQQPVTWLMPGSCHNCSLLITSINLECMFYKPHF